jgi:hypothetical protein
VLPVDADPPAPETASAPSDWLADLAEAYGWAWAAVSSGYRIADASDLHRDTWRRCNDRDVHRAVGVLARLGAVSIDGRQDAMRVTMTELGRREMRRRLSEPGGAAARPESVLPDDAG